MLMCPKQLRVISGGGGGKTRGESAGKTDKLREIKPHSGEINEKSPRGGEGRRMQGRREKMKRTEGAE